MVTEATLFQQMLSVTNQRTSCSSSKGGGSSVVFLFIDGVGCREALWLNDVRLARRRREAGDRECARCNDQDGGDEDTLAGFET